MLRLDDGTELTGFPLPHTLPTDGLRARIAPLADARPGDIAVDELAFTELPQSYVSTLATSSYDPEGVFDTLVQTLPFGPRMMEVVEPALAAGAAGFIGALTGLPWETRDYYVPYDAVERPIPALWLSGTDARRLLDRLPCTGELVAQCHRHGDHDNVSPRCPATHRTRSSSAPTTTLPGPRPSRTPPASRSFWPPRVTGLRCLSRPGRTI